MIGENPWIDTNFKSQVKDKPSAKETEREVKATEGKPRVFGTMKAKKIECTSVGRERSIVLKGAERV